MSRGPRSTPATANKTPLTPSDTMARGGGPPGAGGAVLGVHRADGRPHVTPVVAVWTDGRAISPAVGLLGPVADAFLAKHSSDWPSMAPRTARSEVRSWSTSWSRCRDWGSGKGPFSQPSWDFDRRSLPAVAYRAHQLSYLAPGLLGLWKGHVPSLSHHRPRCVSCKVPATRRSHPKRSGSTVDPTRSAIPAHPRICQRRSRSHPNDVRRWSGSCM